MSALLLVSPKAFLLGFADGCLPLVCSHGLFSVCVCVQVTSSYKDTSEIGLGSL